MQILILRLEQPTKRNHYFCIKCIYITKICTLTTDCFHQSHPELLTARSRPLPHPIHPVYYLWTYITSVVLGRLQRLPETVSVLRSRQVMTNSWGCLQKPSLKVISRLSAAARAAVGVGRCCVSWRSSHKHDRSALFRLWKHEEGRGEAGWKPEGFIQYILVWWRALTGISDSGRFMSKQVTEGQRPVKEILISGFFSTSSIVEN